MKPKQSVECWIFQEDLNQVLLLTVPGKKDKYPDFNQPLTGGLKLKEKPINGCIRELFEETGRKIKPNDLILVKENFMVQITDKLTINKTIFMLKTPYFVPVLSPDEHKGFLWVPTMDVEKNLYYQSNKDTFKLVKDNFLTPIR